MTRLFHTETPTTAQSWDIRKDYANRFGPDPLAQPQEYERRHELTPLGFVHADRYNGDMTQSQRALMVASWFHQDQTDMAKEPYINHCRRTAENVLGWCVDNGINETDTQVAVAVGLLHDVVEDTTCTMNDLQSLGFSVDVLRGVQAMTQWSYRASNGEMVYESLPDYWRRVRHNWHASVVKMCGDIVDNDDEARMERGNMPLPRRLKLHDKYAKARAFIGQPHPYAAPSR